MDLHDAAAWLSLNAKDVLTIRKPPYWGPAGEFCFFMALSITPLITLTGAQWIAPLRRWYGIWFAVIGIADTTTAAITTNFAGGVVGRLAGHTFLLTGLLIITLALPVLATANTPAQRKLGKYWKRLQRMTYVIWGFILLHLLLLDGFRPFGASKGDGDPVFHQRFYQAVAISIPLIVLRLPPVRRWIVEQRAEGRAWLVWLAICRLLRCTSSGSPSSSTRRSSRESSPSRFIPWKTDAAAVRGAVRPDPGRPPPQLSVPV